MELSVSWHDWKRVLQKAVHAAEFVGLSDDRINDLAFLVGEILAKDIDPGNREQTLLNILWNEADENDKKVLAKLIVRMVDKPLHS